MLSSAPAEIYPHQREGRHQQNQDECDRNGIVLHELLCPRRASMGRGGQHRQVKRDQSAAGRHHRRRHGRKRLVTLRHYFGCSHRTPVHGGRIPSVSLTVTAAPGPTPVAYGVLGAGGYYRAWTRATALSSRADPGKATEGH